jgi:hypothetical protein
VYRVACYLLTMAAAGTRTLERMELLTSMDPMGGT